MRSSTQSKSCHIACCVDKQGVHPSLSDQAGTEKLNNGREVANTRALANNGPCYKHQYY